MNLLKCILLLAMTSPIYGQVISRRTPTPQAEEVPILALEKWPDPLQMAWTASEGIQNDAILGKIRFKMIENLLQHGKASQAEAVAHQIPEVSTRYRGLGMIAYHYAKEGAEDEARRLLQSASPGLKVTGSASYHELLLVLVRAAAALPDARLAKQLYAKIGDADTRYLALGARVAFMVPPEGEKDTFPELDELLTPSQETSAITRMYQAQAVLDVAKTWQARKPPISNERLLALYQKSIELASTSMVSQIEHRIAVLQLLDPATLGPFRREVLDQVRDLAQRQNENYEHSPANLIHIGHLETAAGKPTASTFDWEKAALTMIEGMGEDAKREARLLAGAAWVEAENWDTASSVWTAALADLASNPNPNVISASVAEMCLHVDRAGAHSRKSFWEPLKDKIHFLIHGSP